MHDSRRSSPSIRGRARACEHDEDGGRIAELNADGDGTRVVQSYELVKRPLRLFVPIIARTVPHHFDMRPHMADCLERLGVLVESSTSESIPARSYA